MLVSSILLCTPKRCFDRLRKTSTCWKSLRPCEWSAWLLSYDLSGAWARLNVVTVAAKKSHPFSTLPDWFSSSEMDHSWKCQLQEKWQKSIFLPGNKWSLFCVFGMGLGIGGSRTAWQSSATLVRRRTGYGCGINWWWLRLSQLAGSAVVSESSWGAVSAWYFALSRTL